MTVYISGPITGTPNRNKRAFSAAYKEIARLRSYPRRRDIKIVNPLHLGNRLDKAFGVRGAQPKWSDYMRVCVKKLCESECLYFLKGWDASDGACTERYIAKRLGIPCADSIEQLKKIIEEAGNEKN